jgi:hypothetical protein
VIVETGQQIVDEGKSFWEDPFGYVIAPFVAIDDAIDEIIHPEKDRFDQLTEGVMRPILRTQTTPPTQAR